jgi:hypothetical protein
VADEIVRMLRCAPHSSQTSFVMHGPRAARVVVGDLRGQRTRKRFGLSAECCCWREWGERAFSSRRTKVRSAQLGRVQELNLELGGGGGSVRHLPFSFSSSFSCSPPRPLLLTRLVTFHGANSHEFLFCFS